MNIKYTIKWSMEDKSLRKEASKNAWKQLYDITLKLDKLEPWNYLGDTQLVTIQLKDREEPVFCSVMGKFSGEEELQSLMELKA